eukprot:6180911-Pleurochrysis_carterae.AAC.3
MRTSLCLDLTRWYTMQEAGRPEDRMKKAFSTMACDGYMRTANATPSRGRARLWLVRFASAQETLDGPI